MKDREPTIVKVNKTLKESMNTIQNETQKSIIKKSTGDTEIESLDQKRKGPRQKKKKDKVEYAELNKLVKKKCRTRATRKRKSTRNIRSMKRSKTD